MRGIFGSRLVWVSLLIVAIAATLPLYVSAYILGLLTLAYYFGVFALIPFLGFFLAIAAIVLGIVGLRAASQNPQAHGRAHAWVGIVLGVLVFAGHIGFVVWAVIASSAR